MESNHNCISSVSRIGINLKAVYTMSHYHYTIPRCSSFRAVFLVFNNVLFSVHNIQPVSKVVYINFVIAL